MLSRALRGGESSSVAVIDLEKADEKGNVNKAHHLKLKTEFRYTGAGEYLIFGGVDPGVGLPSLSLFSDLADNYKAIISHISISTLLDNMPATPDSEDPFCFKVLQVQEKLSYARHVIKKEAPPMTYSLGRAVGEMVGILRIPPKHFESGMHQVSCLITNADSGACAGVWSLVQDYKPYNAEGARKRGHWSHNEAFKDGAVQGYQAITMASVEIEDNINAAKEIIDIDSGSDSYSNDENDPIPVEVEDWIRSTQASQASLQYFDLERNKWTIQEEELSDDFFAELRDMACNVNTKSPEMDGDRVNEDSMAVPQTRRQDESGNLPSDGAEMDTDVMTESGLAVRSRDSPKELEDLHELCADVLHMHRDEASSPELAAKKMVINYEFGWTGM